MFGGYIGLGHFLAEMTHPYWSLLIGCLCAIALAVVFLHPLTWISRLIPKWFDSDTVAFCAMILLIGFISIFLNWFKLFLPFMMIMSCEALARIDFKMRNFNELKTGLLLVAIAWTGLLAGWAIGVYEFHRSFDLLQRFAL